MSTVVTSLGTGVLLPETTLWAPWAQVLATFVAINTVMYVAVAVAKILPKVHLGDWLNTSYARSETRSIHPRGADGWTVVPPARPIRSEPSADGQADAGPRGPF